MSKFGPSGVLEKYHSSLARQLLTKHLSAFYDVESFNELLRLVDVRGRLPIFYSDFVARNMPPPLALPPDVHYGNGHATA